jgi:hypothetical protein
MQPEQNLQQARPIAIVDDLEAATVSLQQTLTLFH